MSCWVLSSKRWRRNKDLLPSEFSFRSTCQWISFISVGICILWSRGAAAPFMIEINSGNRSRATRTADDRKNWNRKRMGGRVMEWNLSEGEWSGLNWVIGGDAPAAACQPILTLRDVQIKTDFTYILCDSVEGKDINLYQGTAVLQIAAVSRVWSNQ